MAEIHLQLFLDKVRQLNAFVELAKADPGLMGTLRDCEHHHQVVTLAQQHGFQIGRRWGELETERPPAEGNLLAGPCPAAGEERTTVLQQGEGWRLEWIHSCQACSPPGFWYDQPDHEWVCLVQGSARLAFADEAGNRELCRGDSLLIPAHRRHRLVATDAAPGSVWLALFWREPCAG